MRATLLVLALTTACVPRDVRRGDEFALAGDWDRAVEAYQRAVVQQPTNGRITSKLAVAERGKHKQRVAQADAARIRAEAALSAGNFALLIEELAAARALDPQGEAIIALQASSSEHLRSLAEERARAEGWQAAYPLAVLASRLSPDNTQASALLTRARTGVIAVIDERLGAGQFESAQELSALVSQLEPTLESETSARVATAWSAALLKDAQGLEASGDTGQAWLVFARAARIHPSEAAVAGRERNGREQVEDRRVSIAFHKATEPLASDLSTLVRTALSDDGMRLVDAGSELVVSQIKATWSCSEAITPHTQSQRYVASTRWVENPERLAASRDAYTQRAALSEFDVASADAYSAMEAARYAAEQLRAEWLIFEDAALRAEATQAQTETWLQEAEGGLREAEDAMGQAAARGEDTTGYAAARDEWAGVVRTRNEVLQTVNRETSSARKLADDLQAQATRAESELTDTHRAYERASEEHAEAVAAIEQADAVVAGLATEIEEPVYATFEYKAHEVKRTCVVKASAKLGPSKSAAVRTYTETRVTHDRHHDAFPRYEVAEDLLKLPHTDGAMVQDALAKVSATMAAQLLAERDAAYARKAAAAEDGPSKAAIGLLAPSLADPGWLMAEWSLESADLLAR